MFKIILRYILKILYRVEIKGYENVNIRGIMTIGKYTDNSNEIRSYFNEMKQAFEHIKPRSRRGSSQSIESDHDPSRHSNHLQVKQMNFLFYFF